VVLTQTIVENGPRVQSEYAFGKARKARSIRGAPKKERRGPKATP